MSQPPSDADVELARELLAQWDNGNGISKSQLERQTWGDGSSHGRRFDRYIRGTLGVETSRRSRQTDRITDLEKQIVSLGAHPVGTKKVEWQAQLQQARASCLEALRVWNDPTSSFRTGAFALLFVTAWNSLALASLQRDGKEWRRLDSSGEPSLFDGAEQSLDTLQLISTAFPDADYRGIRENLSRWVEIRNAVAHRHLPALDYAVIPLAQAGLLNTEDVLVDVFGAEYGLGDKLSVPLQLSGFRDPDVLGSLKKLQASLPLDVQAVLNRAYDAPADLLADPSYMMRVAFIPAVPASGRSPDVVAYFVRPGEVPSELEETIERYVVLSKPTARPNFSATQVIGEVQRRTRHKLNTNQHAQLSRTLDVRPDLGEPDETLDIKYAEYITSFKRYLYSQAWIDLLVDKLSSPEDFEELIGVPPLQIDTT
ncbi:MAG: hypothetical protein OXH78_04005 [Acidimicrobiaceae bacterium]|nr:hypothetical protein [Acidimicrobiaceae bacterium]